MRAFNQQNQSISEELEAGISHVCDELCLCDGALIKTLDTKFGGASLDGSVSCILSLTGVERVTQS